MSEQLKVAVKRLEHSKGLPLPSYETVDSAGMDIRSAVELELMPGERALIATGFAFELPVGYEMQVRPRSGMAAKKGVTVLNGPGTIDADYRGELKVILINHGPDPFYIGRGDRIAQLIVAPVLRVTLDEVEELEGTERGEGGFGSTGQ